MFLSGNQQLVYLKNTYRISNEDSLMTETNKHFTITWKRRHQLTIRREGERERGRERGREGGREREGGGREGEREGGGRE